MKDYKISLLADIYGSFLSERALQIVRLYFDEDNSLGEIAEKFDISKQGVSDYLNKSISILNEFESKLGNLQRKMFIESKVNEIINFVDNENIILKEMLQSIKDN